ncbi:hypothetical protein BDZ45DRAFT_718951 [Acephala macrosclerotiorum]|nr:hypothetical protein BDZ45DRAFT_718951 [Acephala macrosclerotiorum]
MAAKLQFTQKDVPIIDVHYHYFAPHILGPMGEFVIASPDETPDAMAKLGTSVVIYSPVIWSKYNTEWSSEKWAGFCRTLTDEQAKEVQKAPAQRGSFAPLPFPHIAESIKALQYGEEECVPRPDGYAITTSANNIYLGDPTFDEILQVCDCRKVVLFVHPSETVMPPLDGRTYGFQMIEFPTETARCLMTMIDQGTFTKYPNISWIFSHNGGSFPFLFQRVIRTLSEANNGNTLQEVFAGGNIYIECSQGTAAQQILLKSLGLGPENILTGTTLREMHGPELSSLFNSREIIGIKAGNVIRLMPRLKSEWIKAGIVKEL